MQTLLFVLLVIALICIARILERKWPITATPVSEVVEDWKLISVNFALTTLVAPLTTVSSGIILSATGFGWIHLPMHGYCYFVSIVILAVISDLYTYTFHRFQHAIPFFWAMHSFHHSANALTFVTGGRHLWMERVMSSAVLPIMPILDSFKSRPDMLLIISSHPLLPWIQLRPPERPFPDGAHDHGVEQPAMAPHSSLGDAGASRQELCISPAVVGHSVRHSLDTGSPMNIQSPGSTPPGPRESVIDGVIWPFLSSTLARDFPCCDARGRR